jgi:hypothetical protein
MDQYLNGMITAANWIIAVLFLRYWRDTGDRLFAIFAGSFIALGLSRGRTLMPDAHEWIIATQLLRFAAFVMILLAIIDKNLPRRGSSSDSSEPNV